MGESEELSEISVEGMTCSNCAMGVRKGLENIGLEKVNVDFSSGEVSFQNATGLDATKIENEISRLGYKVNHADKEDHADKKGLSAIEKKFYFCLAFTIPLFFSMFLPFPWLSNPWVQLGLVLPVMAVGVSHFGKSAFHSLRSGFPNMDVLIFIGSTAAFAYSLVGSILYAGTAAVENYLFYETAATIISLVLLGNVLEHRSVKQTTSAIADLSQLQKNMAYKVVQKNGTEEIEIVSAEELKTGELVLVKEGDRIPADGKLKSGEAKVDESMISGESEAILKSKGSQVIGGTTVQQGNFKFIVSAVGKDSVLSKIIQLVKKAQSERPNIQRLGDKVSAIFVPVVIGISLITFSTWYFALDSMLQEALMNAVAVLVISCPCAMGLATPTAVMVGIGRAAKNGILIKGGATVELFAKIKSMVFDKTGTITSGDFQIDNLVNYSNEISTEEIKSLLYSMEQYSAHPIAKSICKQLKSEGVSSTLLMEQEEVKGKGMKAKDMDGNTFHLGKADWLGEIKTEKEHAVGLFKNGELIAGIDLSDEIREGSAKMIKKLRSVNISTVLLSGDREEKTAKIAQQLGFESYYAEKLPDEKLEIIEKLQSKNELAMVGDGINDAPALSKARVGISLSNSTQIAIQSAEVILLKASNLMGIYDAYLLSKHTLLTIKQNLFWAFFYNVLAIPLAAFGFLNPMIAALSMAFSDVIVIGNSLRLRRKKIS